MATAKTRAVGRDLSGWEDHGTPQRTDPAKAAPAASASSGFLAVPLLLLLALLLFYYRTWSSPGVRISHDDGIYLATAKALATAQGYTMISLPDEIRQTKYPILLPLLLAFVWRIDPSFPGRSVSSSVTLLSVSSGVDRV